MKALVRTWSDYLTSGNNAGEAALFRLPVLMIQGQYAYRLVTPAQVAKWHAALPCSGRIVSIRVRGRYATAVFRLGNRKQSNCDAPGTLAAARFTIVGGKITEWRQVPPPSPRPGAEPVAESAGRGASGVTSRDCRSNLAIAWNARAATTPPKVAPRGRQ